MPGAMSTAPFANESEYRKTIQDTMNVIEKSFENVDPDLAECEQAMGAMTITFPDRTRCILSAQPSVRQLWLALASLGTAIHFNYDSAAQQWIDDKGKGIELLAYLRSYLKEKTGLSFGF